MRTPIVSRYVLAALSAPFDMATRRRIRIATRASKLAIWQSNHVAGRLTKLNRHLEIALVPITTAGDRILDLPLKEAGGKGLFIKELEIALADRRADIAVHSMKDVPAALPDGLHLPVILGRDDPRDVLLSRGQCALEALPSGCRIGTSSLRRKSQLLAHRNDLEVRDLRGNVPTRIERLDAGDFDAIILAAAGLRRLGLMNDNCVYLQPDIMLPAIGQGAIGIECRIGDTEVEELIDGLNDAQTSSCVNAERAMNAILGGNCHVPVAGYAHIDGNDLMLTGLVAGVDGKDIVRRTAGGPRDDAERIGIELGESLLAAGADRILRNLAEN
jgi:hydroxymethylbilane synthase